MKRPILIRLPRPPRDAFALPLPSDAAKAKAERYRRLFAALAAHADVVVDAAAKGALTHAEPGATHATGGPAGGAVPDDVRGASPARAQGRAPQACQPRDVAWPRVARGRCRNAPTPIGHNAHRAGRMPADRMNDRRSHHGTIPNERRHSG